jgi:hypothetical protein
MTLAYASDGGVARHLAQSLDAMGDKQGFAAHASGRQRGLGASVTPTYNYNIIFFNGLRHYPLTGALAGA